jgi:hypothetical protein
MENTFYPATTLDGSATLPFVIPSEAEGSAVPRTIPGNDVFDRTRQRPDHDLWSGLRAIRRRLATHHVPNSCVITAFKAHAVISTEIFRHIRVAVLITVIYVWLTMVLIVLAGTLHAIVKTTTRNLAVFRRRRIPAARGVCLRRRARWRRILSRDCPTRTQ